MKFLGSQLFTFGVAAICTLLVGGFIYGIAADIDQDRKVSENRGPSFDLTSTDGQTITVCLINRPSFGSYWLLTTACLTGE